MVAVESPEWLPPGFTVKFKYKDGKKVKYYFNVASGKKYLSKKEVIRCAAESNSVLVIPQTKNADYNGPSLIDKVDAISDKTNDSAAWLPNGWTVEERRRKSGSAEGAVYMVYTESSTGRRFYSKAAVTRHLNTIALADITTKQNKIDNVAEPVPQNSPQIISMTNTDGAHEQKRKRNSLVTIDNVGEPFPDMSPRVISTTNTDGVPRKKKKGSSFVTVAIERTTADDLPSGWIKEIRTSISGRKIRKDPYYTDPVSGYMFRSKPDALRYLKTNDISSCACKPLKREDDIKLIENKNPSSNPANQKLSVKTRRSILGEESNGGGESSGTKSPAELSTKTLKQKQVNHDSAKVAAVGALSCENSYKNAEIGNNTEAESDVSKKDIRVMAVDVAMSSPMTDSSTKQQSPESGVRNKVGSRKSKKRKDLSMPLRTSKRLAGSEPEMQSNLNLSEHTLRAAMRGPTASEVDDTSPSVPLEVSDIPQTSNIEPAKEAVDHAPISEETRQDVKELKEVEKPPHTEGSSIPEEQSGTKASEKPLDDGQQSQVSQLVYDFGDSWSDPLEFALKTLRGEIPIEDTLTFPSCFDKTSSQADGCLQQSKFDAPINFQSDFGSCSESSKKQNAVDPLPSTPPPFSALGSIGFNSCAGFNFQPSTEAGKKDSQTKFNP